MASRILQKYFICVTNTAFHFTLTLFPYNHPMPSCLDLSFSVWVLSIMAWINTSFDTLIKQNGLLWRRSFPLKYQFKCFGEDYILLCDSRRGRKRRPVKENVRFLCKLINSHLGLWDICGTARRKKESKWCHILWRAFTQKKSQRPHYQQVDGFMERLHRMCTHWQRRWDKFVGGPEALRGGIYAVQQVLRRGFGKWNSMILCQV